jgi:hypothetical protein
LPCVSARPTAGSLKAFRLKANAKPNVQRATCEAAGAPPPPPRSGFVQRVVAADAGIPTRLLSVAIDPARLHSAFVVMNTLLAILFVSLVVSCPAGFVLHGMLLSQLRSRHPRTWEMLGRPTMFLNNSIANGLAVQRFLWRRQYVTLGDTQFSRLASFLRGYLLVYLLLFIVTIGVFISGISSQR